MNFRWSSDEDTVHFEGGDTPELPDTEPEDLEQGRLEDREQEVLSGIMALVGQVNEPLE